MPIKQLNSVAVKAGKNATSSYKEWNAIRPAGLSGALGVKPDAMQPVQLQFGQTGRASISTIAGRDVTSTQAPNPNFGQFNIQTQPHVVPMRVHGQGAIQYPPSDVPLIMPHERGIIGANDSRNMTRRSYYRPVMGASTTVVKSDTAFRRTPIKVQKKHKARSATEAVKIPRSAQPSFASNQNLWVDPNNSFYKGRPSVAGTGVGTGRWNVTKEGAAG